MPYQPRLTWKSHVWRVLVMLFVSAMAWSGSAPHQWNENRTLFWVDLAAGLACYGLVHLRRSHPLVVPVVVVLLGSVSLIAAGPATLAVVSVATRRQWLEIVPIAILTVLTGQSSNDIQSLNADPWWVFASNVVITIALVASGMYVGSRRELVWTLRERADTAERQQEMRVAQARLVERERIAREMHDVLAHRISLVSMHAGALAFRTDLGDPDVRRAAEVINDNANHALTDLRSVLGVLRDDGSPSTSRSREAPQPTFVDVAPLIAEARRFDMHVDDEINVDSSETMPDTTGRTVYRIVQEALTNVRKHAPHAITRIRITGAPDAGITIESSNPLPPGADQSLPSSGLGLVGMAERVEIAGGRIDHSLTGDRFELRAWLPWPK